MRLPACSFIRFSCPLTLSLALALPTLASCQTSSEEDEPDEPLVLTAAKVLIEHNATDEDTGFQVFADGEPWDELVVTGPDGDPIVTATPEDSFSGFGLTEFFFETNEPPNADVPIADVVARLPEGTYTFRGEVIGAGTQTLTTTFTHTIPAGPVITGPEDEADDVDPNDTTVEWDPVTETVDGSTDVTIVGYQVLVTKAEPSSDAAFAERVFSIYLPASATSIAVPSEFMEADAPYDLEVLAIEESGNQTLTTISFTTGTATEPAEAPHQFELTAAKLLIEHNATDEDTGFQGFADGDPYSELRVGDAPLLRVTAQGGLADFGLTELFFETSEPANDEVPIPDVLARIPADTYTFAGDMIGADENTRTATFTHDIPAGPVLLGPEDGANDIDPDAAEVSWEPVTRNRDDSADVTVIAYQVIVEEDREEPEFPQGFATPALSMHLPPTTTSVSVPPGFLRAGTAYKYEVLAIEESGNQTLSTAAFETQ